MGNGALPHGPSYRAILDSTAADECRTSVIVRQADLNIAICKLRALRVMLLLRPPEACARRYAQDSSSDSRQEPFPCLSLMISGAGRRL